MGADLERDLEVAVKALAVALLASWGLLLGLAAMHAHPQGSICFVSVLGACIMRAVHEPLFRTPHTQSYMCWYQAFVNADLFRRRG